MNVGIKRLHGKHGKETRVQNTICDHRVDLTQEAILFHSVLVYQFASQVMLFMRELRYKTRDIHESCKLRQKEQNKDAKHDAFQVLTLDSSFPEYLPPQTTRVTHRL